MAEDPRTANFTSVAGSFSLEQARYALARRGEFGVALSEGNTRRPIYGEFVKDSDAPESKIIIDRSRATF